MSIDFNGTNIETTATGYLVETEDWSEDLARHMAAKEDIELTAAHWDIVNFLREEYFDNGGNQPNTRAIVKAMSEAWGRNVDTTALYELFPLDPSKQGGRIAGLPESRRKGGY
jgi:tRNA 2-thiouridine synthesizing protein E